MIGFGDPWTTPLNPLLRAMRRAPARRAAHRRHGQRGARGRAGTCWSATTSRYDAGFVGASLSGPIACRRSSARAAARSASASSSPRRTTTSSSSSAASRRSAALREVVNALPAAATASCCATACSSAGRSASTARRSAAATSSCATSWAWTTRPGAIAMGDYVRVGQTVQFHVRDAATADEDLRCDARAQRQRRDPPAGALLFSCNGRGTRLFDAPCHDIDVARRAHARHAGRRLLRRRRARAGGRQEFHPRPHRQFRAVSARGVTAVRASSSVQVVSLVARRDASCCCGCSAHFELKPPPSVAPRRSAAPRYSEHIDQTVYGQTRRRDRRRRVRADGDVATRRATGRRRRRRPHDAAGRRPEPGRRAADRRGDPRAQRRAGRVHAARSSPSAARRSTSATSSRRTPSARRRARRR